jgi:simple sugar transport system ATP-binding protein
VARVDVAETTAPELAALMVGRAVEAARRVPHDRAIGAPLLELAEVTANGDRGREALRHISLAIRAGEILGVAGVAGNGQRELAEVVTGMRPAVRGSVHIDGELLELGDPRKAIRAGIAHVPEDRLHTGVAPSLSIASNVVLKSYKGSSASRGPFLRLARIREQAVDLIHRYDVKAPGHHAPARQLSGGNLQKVVLGREFSGSPRVLVAAAPTRGLDIGAIEAVHAFLFSAAAKGVAILLISEDLDEVLALADRVVVMYEGEIVGEVDPDNADLEEISLLMAGVRGSAA